MRRFLKMIFSFFLGHTLVKFRMFIFLSGTLTDRNAKQSHLKKHRQSLLPIPPPLLTPLSPFQIISHKNEVPAPDYSVQGLLSDMEDLL